MIKNVIELIRVSTEGQAADDRAGIPANPSTFFDRGVVTGSGLAPLAVLPQFDPMLSARPGSPVSEGRKD